MLLKPTTHQIPAVKPMINIGCLFDIPTGFYLTGKYGESILNGGLASLTAIIGRGNFFKSTIKNHMLLSAFDKIYSVSPETMIYAYDTEINVHETALRRFTEKFKYVSEIKDIFQNNWIITDKEAMLGDEFFKELKEFFSNKESHSKELTFTLPFLDRDNKTLIKSLLPTFGDIDSLTEFTTSDVADIQEKYELGDSGANTIYMRQGLSKMRLLMELPTLASKFKHYIVMTGQVGNSPPMQGPINVPVKKLQFMKFGDSIKGVTDKFTFLIHNLWQVYNSTSLLNKGTNEPEYPSGKSYSKDPDLNLVSMLLGRSKSGTSGVNLELVVSQKEGLLPHLTQFHYIKSNNRFGITGSNINYSLDIYPKLNLSRTTVRDKIDNDPKLRRALEITSELSQIHQYWRDLDSKLYCTPKELYEGIKSKGYDWDEILGNTRGWWTINNDKHPIPFLSTLDLMKMRIDQYKPSWHK